MMDIGTNKFGRGPRELTGARDLVSQYKLLPHHEFFCKKSPPVSLLETQYLYNVVGDTDIRKGEGMQLNQLIRNTFSRDTSACIQPFKLEVLGEAFHLRESSFVDLPPSEKGIPTVAVKTKSESKDKTKHKKHKDKDRDKKLKELKKNEHRSKEEDTGNHKSDKKKKRDGVGDTNGIKKHKKSKQ